MRRHHALAIAVVSAIAVLVTASPATSAAVTSPRAGSYAQVTRSDVLQFQVQGGRVTNFDYYDSCVLVPIRIPSLKLVNGTFQYAGKPLDYLRGEWQVHLDGTFVSPTQATVHWSAQRLSSGGCTSHHTFTATHY